MYKRNISDEKLKLLMNDFFVTVVLKLPAWYICQMWKDSGKGVRYPARLLYPFSTRDFCRILKNCECRYVITRLLHGGYETVATYTSPDHMEYHLVAQESVTRFLCIVKADTDDDFCCLESVSIETFDRCRKCAPVALSRLAEELHITAGIPEEDM